MSRLTEFRDHCQRMATAEHKPECTLSRTHWLDIHPHPECDGCLTDADRALFAQMAGEVADYLDAQVDLFGDVSVEPTRETA